MKECYKCRKVKEFNDFSKNKKSKDGYKYICKNCVSLIYGSKGNSEYFKKYHQENRKRILNLRKLRYEKNKEKELRMKNFYEKRKMKEDEEYKIRKLLRNRIRIALKKGVKTGSAVRDLGCSIKELKQHLELQFQLGMTWGNHGVHGWHIDHIKPLASFNLTDRKQFLEACHYTNLQPLWAQENLSKGASL